MGSVGDFLFFISFYTIKHFFKTVSHPLLDFILITSLKHFRPGFVFQSDWLYVLMGISWDIPTYTNNYVDRAHLSNAARSVSIYLQKHLNPKDRNV